MIRSAKSTSVLSSLRRRLALAFAALALVTSCLGVLPMAAQAAGTTTISGTAVSGAGRWPYAHVGVYRWVNGGWQWLGYSTTATSAGNYSLTVASGYYYYVLGEETYGNCFSGGYEYLWGNSASFVAVAGGVVHATVSQNSVTHMYC